MSPFTSRMMVKPDPSLPRPPVLRLLRAAALCPRRSQSTLAGDEWTRWPGMPWTIAEPEERAYECAATHPPLSERQVRVLVRQAVTNIRLTGKHIDLPGRDKLTLMIDEYTAALDGAVWDLARLLAWIETFAWRLDRGARRDNDALLAAAGVNPNAVANRTYDPATAYADLHVATWAIDEIMMPPR